jgi:pimeloyl-ACP methyl ester carboxylesterase
MKLGSLMTMIAACLALPGMAGATDGTFDSNGVKVRYVTEGSGEAVLFIHGWMGDSSTWGADKAGNTKLASSDGFQVIALDCRGHGQSGKPHDPAQYGAEMAEDVVRLLDHLKIKRAHLVGYSMGAFIAGNVVANHPERVISVVYGGQVPLVKGAPPSGSTEVAVFAKAVEEGKGLGPYLIEVAPKDRPKPTLEQANAFAEILYGGKDVKAFAAAGLSLDNLEVPLEALQKGKVPSLFIYGSKEPDHLKGRVASLRESLEGVEVKVLEGASHVTALRNPEFGATIDKFIRGHLSKDPRS